MASSMSKRQQARNERTLQDLIRTTSGNDQCADCSAKNPAWASWNLGIFLCMRCAALHRKLGTHISKVKSLSMDSWTAEQVENMRSVGNVASNKTFNPQNVRPDIPIDADEADMAIEKYIRQKYEQRTLSGNARSHAGPARQNTGSTETGSWNDEPPPLPPKPGKRFGFSLRSTSSALPRTKADRFTPPLSPAFNGTDRSDSLPSPKKTSKPTQLFGMRITTIENNFDSKLEKLRDMGFSDNKKNTELLKSMNGNLDKTVEALTRLGEGAKSVPRSHTPVPRVLTPVSMGSSGTSGITIEKRRESEKKAATNPWESVTFAAQQAIQQEPPRSRSVPPSTSWNPFLHAHAPPVPQPPLDLAFQTLQISQPQPQNIENSTMSGNNPWQTQHVPQRPQSSSPFGQPYQQHAQTFQSGNPYFQTSQPQVNNVGNPWASQMPQQQASAVQQTSNPFGAPPQAQNAYQQLPVASPAPLYGQQQDFYAQAQSVQQSQPQQMPLMTGQNPWAHQSNSQPMSSQPQYFPQQHQQSIPQQPVRHDKTSILALYNYPQLAPQRPLQTLPEDASVNTTQQRSVTMPALSFAGSMNPFQQGPPQTTQSVRHVSNESMDFQGLAGHGRHSPDAFAGLSAQYMR